MTQDWIPSERQQFALSRNEFEVLYGGARGGGKTDCGMAWLLYDIEHPKYRALVIRRNAEDLKDWIDRAETFYMRNGARRVGNPAEFHFPSGSIIRTGHLKDAGAYTKYMGHEYHRMVIEELTHIPREDDYMKLLASCRSTVPELKPQVFCTTNPGSAGHEWVKKRFVVAAEPQTPFKDPISGRTRIYVPALVYDNPHIVDNDPDYVKYLDSLPANLRKQWLEGSWEDFDIEGAIFGPEMREAREQGRITRIPFDLYTPTDYVFDLGRNDMNSIWFVQRVGREIRLPFYLQDQFKGLRDYMYIIKDKEDRIQFKRGRYIFPHDIGVHEYTTNKTRLETFQVYFEEIYGYKPVEYVDYLVVPRMKQMQDGHDAGRIILPFCWFDAENCAEGIYALKSYHRKKIEGTTIYTNEPVHDEHSHGASAFMQYALQAGDVVQDQQRREQKELRRQTRVRLPQKVATVNYLTGENY